MYLTKTQELILEGEHGEALSKMLHLIVKIGEANHAERLIPIQSAQIAGVSYLTVGDAIFSFFQMLNESNLRVKVPAWLNPAGMDLLHFEEMGVDRAFASKQLQIIEQYKKLGIETTLTCTPYLVGHKPSFGSHLAWSESSAVSMANSFFGARTNREGGPSSLASALTGFTAEYGLHLSNNRYPEVLIRVNTSMNSSADFSALGYWFGKRFGGKIPFFKGIKNFTIDFAKSLSAAMAASGSVALYHIDKFTPEAKEFFHEDFTEVSNFTEEDKKNIFSLFSGTEKVDLVTIGCPHSSKEELIQLASLLKDKEIRSDVEIMVFTSRAVLADPVVINAVHNLSAKGIRVYADTCMVVSPVVRKNFRTILTNSSKAAFYLSKNKENTVFLNTIDEIVGRVTK